MGLNVKNRTLFHGDNLKFLRAMNSKSVDLIATDPPFNKGRDFHATPDSLAAGARFQDRWSWEQDVHEVWVDQITDDFPHVMNVIQGSRSSYGDDMGAFLCFMAVRLLEMRRIMKRTASIYLHCDPTASHYLKELMDAVFGKRNFINEIIWSYKSGGGSRRHFGKKHDTLLWYSRKFKNYVFNPDEVRVPYSAVIAKKRKHLFNKKGKVSGDVWDIPRPPNHSKEWVGYPTQKPIALYDRIIRASSHEGNMILDPFAGCATTCVAAERLGREWVGIDIWAKAHETIIKRLQAEGLAAGGDSGGMLAFGDIHYATEAPSRTDESDEAVAFLQVRERIREPQGQKMSRAEIYEFLLAQYGAKCQGCNRSFDDRRYLQLDHNTPRSDGGLNHISNRVLLCGPCNQAKSNIYTLSGLRRLNKKNGWMAR